MTANIQEKPYDKENIAEAKESIFTLLVYKAKTIHFFPFIKAHFSLKDSVEKGKHMERLFRYLILTIFSIEVSLTAVDLIVSNTGLVDPKQVKSEIEYIYLDIMQIILALTVMILLWYYQKFTDKVAKRDDPFSNAVMLSLVIFLVVLQKYVVEAALSYLLGDAGFFTQNLLVTFRQTFLAIEILFVQIPFRHNFSLEHVET